jgi:hypothetical protein
VIETARRLELAVPDGLWVNVGSGPSCPEGWLCIDGSWQAWLAGSAAGTWLARRLTSRQAGHWPRGIVCRDVRRGLGLAPASAAVVFSSHLIEHLHRSDALALLRDAHHALKPGCVCRVVTPDLKAAVDAYVDAHHNGHADTAGDALQQFLFLHPASRPAAGGLLGAYRRRTDFDHHKWVYDGESLCALFREADFGLPRICAYLESEIPRERLSAVEHADRVLNGAGICVEARK